jgi:GDP-L-fucose synthase
MKRYPEETNAPYGLAKKMLLVQSQAYRAQFGFESIYLLKAETVELWGDGSPTREFLFVDDAARGIVDAMERYSGADLINLGSSFEISIKDLAELISTEIGYPGTIRWDTSKPNGQPRRKLDVSRARDEFGFVSSTDFATGLAETIRWYLQR